MVGEGGEGEGELDVMNEGGEERAMTRMRRLMDQGWNKICDNNEQAMSMTVLYASSSINVSYHCFQFSFLCANDNNMTC